MKDFAKSIYVGNSNKAEIIEKKKKEGATLKVDNGQKLEFSDGSTYVKTSFSDDYREAHNHVGNNIPNAQINGPSAAEIREIAGRVYKTDMRGEDLARAVSFELGKKYKSFQTNSYIMGMVKEVLSKFKIGNKKVGNADIYSGNYIIMGDDGDVWFRDEHEDVSIKYIDSWAQKKIAAYQRSIDEIKKGVAEAKQQAKKYGLL